MEVEAVQALLVISADVKEELEVKKKEELTASAAAPSLRNKLGVPADRRLVGLGTPPEQRSKKVSSSWEPLVLYASDSS